MIDQISRLKPVFVMMSLLAFLIALPVDHAMAALVDTQSADQSRSTAGAKVRLLLLLEREDIKSALLHHGINPAEAEARVRALSDDEISTLDNLPAGSGMIGVSAYVILLPIAAVVLVIALIAFWVGYKVGESRENNLSPIQAHKPGLPPTSSTIEPWSGKWKVSSGKVGGMWVLKQNGDRVVSAPESDYVVDAKSTGAVISGTWFEKSSPYHALADFSATIAEDGLSFTATGTRLSFTATKMD